MRFWSGIIAMGGVALVSGVQACDSGDNPLIVQVEGAGNGSGHVVLSNNLDCYIAGGTATGGCGARIVEDFFPQGSHTATLTALPDPGNRFDGWTGCSSTAGAECTVDLNTQPAEGYALTATFSLEFGENLLINPGFEDADVTVGGPPEATGLWQGDLAARTLVDQGILPHGGLQMLKYAASSPAGAGAGAFASRQWQIVYVASYAAFIDAGKVRLDASVFVNRVAGDAGTDRRFDLRVFTLPGDPANFPGVYPPPASQTRSAQVTSTATNWELLQAEFDVLPTGTRFVALEISAYEDVQDDAIAPEFDGHYADDASLVLTQLP